VSPGEGTETPDIVKVVSPRRVERCSAARLNGTQRQAMPPVYKSPITVNTTAIDANAIHIQVVHVGRRRGGCGMAPPSEKVRDITLLLSIGKTSIDRANSKRRESAGWPPGDHATRAAR
jgi:hypothetical protein